MFFRRQTDPAPLPPWMKMAALLFILYVLFLSITGKVPSGLPVAGNVKQIDWAQQFNLEEYKSKVFPGMNTPLRITDGTVGTGNPVVCGQDVTLRFEAFLPDGKKIDGTADTPLTFTPGQEKVVPALDRGVLSMRPGGKRTIMAAATMAYGAPGFAKDHEDLSNAMIRFELELLDAQPEAVSVSGDKALSGRAFDARFGGSGETLNCGDDATVRIAIWKNDGTLLYSNMDENALPLQLHIGSSQAPRGLEEGLIGMVSSGSNRTLILPPYLLTYLRPQPLTGERVLKDISLPADQLVIMDVVTAQQPAPK